MRCLWLCDVSDKDKYLGTQQGIAKISQPFFASWREAGRGRNGDADRPLSYRPTTESGGGLVLAISHGAADADETSEPSRFSPLPLALPRLIAKCVLDFCTVTPRNRGREVAFVMEINVRFKSKRTIIKLSEKKERWRHPPPFFTH